jgi:4'-phosphopantetheinyl transferase
MAADLEHCAAAESDRSSRTFGVLKTPAVDIVGVRLDASAGIVAALWQLLSRDEQERAEKFRFSEHRQHYIVARGNLRRLLAERLRIAPRAVEFVENNYGKPKLAPVHGSADLDFNLSHSGALALYAFTSGRAVGVDVELIREIPDIDDLAERFFSPTEIASLKAFPVAQRSSAFLACWTRKEAFIKALGQGLTCPLDAFDVTIDPDAPARITRIKASIERVANWTMQAFAPSPCYIAAVAYRR